MTDSDKLLDQLVTEKNNLVGKLPRAYRPVLLNIANYFKHTTPTQINDLYIIEVEATLHQLFQVVSEEESDSNIVDMTIEVLAQVAELSEWVQVHTPKTKEQRKEPRDRDFFRTVMVCSRLINRLALLLR